MKLLIVTAAVLIAGFTLADQATAADPHHHSAPAPAGDHGPNLTLVGHHGHSYHGRPYYAPPRAHYYPSPYYRYEYRRPAVVVQPPVVVPYPGYYPYGYSYYPYGYSYYRGGVSVNTGRVGFSIAF